MGMHDQPDDPAKGRYCSWKDAGITRGEYWMLQDRLSAAEAQVDIAAASNRSACDALMAQMGRADELQKELDRLRDMLGDATLARADAHRAGFSAGLEAGAKLVDRWHIKKGGYGAQAEAIRALAAATGEKE